MQPGSHLPQQIDADARRLAWRRSSLRSRRAMVGVLCTVALTAGIVGSNLYNRLQGVDINDRAAPLAELPPLSGNPSNRTAPVHPADVSTIAINTPSPPVGLTPVLKTAPSLPVTPVAPVASVAIVLPPNGPHVASGVVLASETTPGVVVSPAIAMSPATATATAPATAANVATPNSAADAIARKRIANAPRLRLDSTLHDLDWLRDGAPQSTPTAQR